ncbi:MAG: hypothetical protein AB8B86_07930 [Pseudomonadales bacterium]
MDKRLYFVLGDLITNVVAGMFVAGLCYLIFDTGWNMIIAMFVAMALGMLFSMIVWFPASILYGAMEVMLPVMLTGMYSGMIVGMWASMHPLSLTTALLCGAITGFITVTIVWIVNNQLRGRRHYGPTSLQNKTEQEL